MGCHKCVSAAALKRTRACICYVVAIVCTSTSATRADWTAQHLQQPPEAAVRQPSCIGSCEQELERDLAAHRGADAAKLAAGSTECRRAVIAQGGSGKWRTVTAGRLLSLLRCIGAARR